MTENSNGPDLSGTKLVEGGVLPYLLRSPQPDSGKLAPLLIMMHGRGANEGDIFELVPYVDPRVMIVAPRAPLLNTNDPRGSFKWYETVTPGISAPGSIEASVQTMLKFVAAIENGSDVKIDPSQIYIGGFSQGAAMSYGLMAARPDLFAGVIAHSSPFSAELEKNLKSADLKGKPFFIAHGTEDFLSINDHGKKAADLLKELGADVTYRVYPFAHETSVSSRRDLAEWLNPRIRG